MLEEIDKEKSEISDQEKIADLIVENQMLKHKVIILAELAWGASRVLDYYASSKLSLPTFTLVDSSIYKEQSLYSEAKYKITEVLNTSGPDKEILVGKEMYNLRIDTQTAENMSKQIKDKFEELDIKVESDYVGQEQGEQLPLDLEGSQQ